MKNDLVLLRKTRYIELLLTSFQTFCAVIGRNIGHYLQIFRGCVQRTFSSGRILSASWRFAVQGSSEIKVGKIKMHLKIHTWMLLISLYESHFFHARKRCGLESTLLPNSAHAGVLQTLLNLLSTRGQEVRVAFDAKLKTVDTAG